ncbi:MAG: acetyltransferase [Candidatus Marinimicrobia bacterium]|nr:acetyltransferase [Candidatus Neomarinimicrobiota bacterium]
MVDKEKIAIIGAGGFGNEVYHLLDKDKFEPIGFIDNNNLKENLPFSVIGNEDVMSTLMENYQFASCVIAIGNIKKRQKIYSKIGGMKLRFPQIIHSSIQSHSADIGEGTIIYPNVVIMNGCKVGKFSLINSGVTFGHDVLIGDFCNINPGVHLAGKITIGDGSFIGIGASIKEDIHIGGNAVIGAGSVVLKDVPDGTTVYGVPAKKH